MNKPHIAVIGAGAMGGWAAWHLLQKGIDVSLLDAWGPGHSRASSGGETRVIRGIYGEDRVYVEWVVRALELWNELGEEWNEQLYHKTGLLWMFVESDDYARLSIPVIEQFGLAVDSMTHVEAAQRFPQVNFDDVQSIYFEHEAGYLKARHACRVVCEQFQRAGGTYRQSAVQPEWNQRGGSLQISRQEVYYFGTPAGVESFDAGNFPAWLNFEEPLYYGVPTVDRRGFKICDDSRTRSIDPSTDSRVVTESEVQKARAFLAKRFPLLKDAPLVESRVCIDRHPDSAHVWSAGGGSGHSFKLGPAFGEHVAACVLGETTPLEMFSLERFQHTNPRSAQHAR